LIDEQVIRLEPGSKVLFYTDGATDATDDQDQPLDRERLVQLFHTNHKQHAQEIADDLLTAILAHQGNNPQFDDITLIVANALPI
jgi:sigma-B regulation protein RsbU (phosphoserine phosphatase)